MQYRKLGKTALNVSEVSFGGHQIGSYGGKLEIPLEQRVKVIERGLELGINYFDTTEPCEAESLSAVFKILGGIPEHVTVTSIFTEYRNDPDIIEGIKDKVRVGIEKSLGYFDPIDIFNLCGNGFPYSKDRTLWALEALEEAKDQGKIKHYGFSTHLMNYALSMIENHAEFCLVMFPFNLLIPKVADILFPVAQKHDVAVVGMKVMAARGILNLEIDPQAYGRDLSIPIAAIKWVLDHAEVSCTIPAMNSIAEVEENTRASGAELSEDELRILERVREEFGKKVKPGPQWYFYRDWTERLYGEDLFT